MTQATRKWSVRKQIAVCAVVLSIGMLVLSLTGAIHPAWIAALSGFGAFVGYIGWGYWYRLRSG